MYNLPAIRAFTFNHRDTEEKLFSLFRDSVAKAFMTEGDKPSS